jgi:hypothetical protein
MYGQQWSEQFRAAGDLARRFPDPTIPNGFNPFNIQNVGGQLYVA